MLKHQRISYCGDHVIDNLDFQVTREDALNVLINERSSAFAA
jgi:hypothetical protein